MHVHLPIVAQEPVRILADKLLKDVLSDAAIFQIKFQLIDAWVICFLFRWWYGFRLLIIVGVKFNPTLFDISYRYWCFTHFRRNWSLTFEFL